jgi:hypothetical protein
MLKSIQLPEPRSEVVRQMLQHRIRCSLAMEHFRSIIMLCRSGVATGSALALFRPLWKPLFVENGCTFARVKSK